MTVDQQFTVYAPNGNSRPTTLYNFPWGPYPRRLTIYLLEKSITDIVLVGVEFPHQPALWPSGFLPGLNPAHSLPVLEIGNGAKIGQSVAIMEYLEERYANPDLIGETPEARAATRAMVAVFDEAASFFGIWARHGSRLFSDNHLGRCRQPPWPVGLNGRRACPSGGQPHRPE